MKVESFKFEYCDIFITGWDWVPGRVSLPKGYVDISGAVYQVSEELDLDPVIANDFISTVGGGFYREFTSIPKGSDDLEIVLPLIGYNEERVGHFYETLPERKRSVVGSFEEFREKIKNLIRELNLCLSEVREVIRDYVMRVKKEGVMGVSQIWG